MHLSEIEGPLGKKSFQVMAANNYCKAYKKFRWKLLNPETLSKLISMVFLWTSFTTAENINKYLLYILFYF